MRQYSENKYSRKPPATTAALWKRPSTDHGHQLKEAGSFTLSEKRALTVPNRPSRIPLQNCLIL
ncbi:hypothetical protein HAX54_049073, partial [Datura stramonium]|nr:hypothetical protein [Datura stramonium]